MRKATSIGILTILILQVTLGMWNGIETGTAAGISLPFWDDFEDGNIDNWNDVSDTYGSIRVETGNLDGTGSYYLYLDSPPEPDNQARAILENSDNPSWTIYAFEFDAKIDYTSGSYAYLNVFFLLQSTVSIDDGYYVHMRAQQDSMTLFKREAGVNTQLATVSWTINTGTVYHIKVEVKDGIISYYVDGTKAIEAVDTTHTHGTVGFSTHGAGAETVRSAIDNIHVYYIGSALPDLSISSDDIEFSNPNPMTGETITIDATVHSELGLKNKWEKYHENPVMVPGPGGYDSFRASELTVIKDGGVYKVWYSAWDGSTIAGENVQTIAYATSLNGIDWTKYGVVMGLGSSGDFDSLALRAPFVLLDGGVYKMWYHGYDDYHRNKIGYATSTDGIAWTKHPSNPVLDSGPSGSWDDYHVNSPSVIREGGTYQLWYSGHDGSSYRIGYATSSDGVSWTKYIGNPVLNEGPSGSWDEYQAAYPKVIEHDGTYDMLYTGQGPSTLAIGHATSTDRIGWTKHGIVLEGSPSQWDAQIWSVGNILIEGDFYKLWYTATSGNPQYLSIGYAYQYQPLIGYSNDWVEYSGNPLTSTMPMTGPSVLYDGSGYKMWYNTYPVVRNIAYAYSSNGIDWTEYPGNPLFGSNNVYSPCVLFDGTQYQMWYTKAVGGATVINYATSVDGINWSHYPGNPVVGAGSPGEWDDFKVWSPSVIFDEGIYKMWYKGVGSIYRIGYATSPDGITWTKHPGNPVLYNGPAGSWDEMDVGEPSVLKDGDKYIMWFSGTDASINSRIGYAVSSDGINWIKSGTNPILDIEPGTWKSVYANQPCVLKIGNSFKMWFNGWDGSMYRLGLATLDAGTTATVSFYDGDPSSGGTLIGQTPIYVWDNSPLSVSEDWTASPGLHDIYVCIENVNPGDHNLSNNVAWKSISVGGPPEADAGDDQKVNEGDVVLLDGTGSSDPDGPISSYEWDFDAGTDSDGDGNSTNDIDGTGQTPTHIYGDNGVFTVILTVIDAQNLTDSDTCVITVLNVDPTVTIESVLMNVEIGLRVAGRKYNDVGMTLYEEGIQVAYLSVERMPGSPDDQMVWTPMTLDLIKTYTATVTYLPEDPPNVGANPVWIYIKFENGSQEKIHHTFNVQQSMKRDSGHWNHVEPWEVDLNEHLIGREFTLASHVTDPGSDDEILLIAYGTQNLTKTYYNDGGAPDPYPSPEINPVDLYDITNLTYEGPGSLMLTVTDDDGGIDSTVVMIS